MKRFKDKIVIIAGADSAIGHATALRFAFEEAIVILVGLDRDFMENTAEQLPVDTTWIHAEPHLTITCDINEISQLQALVEHVIKKYEKIDVLVNLNSNFDVCQVTLPELIKSKGTIVSVPSLSSMINDWNMATYNEAIHSVSNLTQSLARENGAYGVRVNAVSPSVTLEDMRSHDPSADDKIQRFLARSPLGRLANSEDIAAAVTFLASEDADIITGVTLHVDGGVSINHSTL